ncbi:phytoene desaturase [Paenibacillus castaneae]|uniref:phytoene desaturase family protein n=1 Tax=Paenibacillus castaneae TaxID=474957 RepID=UPI000C99A67B|nr:phytoene desaturase family protein [Paenibacillus castaneae]NIK76019.1 phytoene desaturase [Paenibacillus castaneae]
MSTMSNKTVIIIGAGLGGLSAAIRLAHAGFRVRVLEQQATVGGKLQRITEKGYRFDRGPSTITLPHLFENVFTAADRHMEDYVKLERLQQATRNVFPGGETVDLTDSIETTATQIACYSKEDAAAYPAFCKEAARLYRLADERFLGKLMLGLKDKLDPRLAAGFLQVKPLTTLHTLLRRYFRHPNTLSMLGRYATYVGASPYASPAIFAMLAHVESELGIYRVQGGTYAIAEAFAKLAEELGVTIETNASVQKIIVKNGAARGVETDQGYYEADIVLANGDALSIYSRLIAPEHRPSLPNKKIDRYEPSLSGFVQLVGIRRTYEQLLHHTVYYPECYKDEFKSIFTARKPPEDPTIYICNNSASDREAAPAGASSLFVLVNAPYVSNAWSWEHETEKYAMLVRSHLADHGILGLEQAEVTLTYTPEQLERDTSAYRGAIYGISSNGARQTFFRPGNCAKDIKGLWFTGGTTHPGGGTPIVTLCGQLVAEELIKQYKI